MVYRAFRKSKAIEWLHRLKESNGEIIPSAEQMKCTKIVVDRCVEESQDEQSDLEYESEPLRAILHGVPGVYFHRLPYPFPFALPVSATIATIIHRCWQDAGSSFGETVLR